MARLLDEVTLHELPDANLVTASEFVTLESGEKVLTHETRRYRLPLPMPGNKGPFPTFMLTLPDLGRNNQCLRVFERALTALGGGFTSWQGHGVWNDAGEFIWEDVLVFVVATEKEHELRGIYRACLDELGEKEGFFVAIGSHTIV